MVQLAIKAVQFTYKADSPIEFAGGARSPIAPAAVTPLSLTTDN